MDGPEEERDENWLTELRAVLAGLPRDYRQSYNIIRDIRHKVLREIAVALQPRLNQEIEQLPQSEFAEKQRIVTMVNQDLRLLNLCVRCPATSGPAILVTDFRDNEERNSRFRFQIVDSSGRQLRKNSSDRLPELNLMEAPPREEHFAGRDRRKGGGRS
jgi:hypothetical protein